MSSITPSPVSIAPMMDWTDRHCRFFLRLISPSTLLYTEMITTAALINGDSEYLLAYHPEEHPLAIQLGGSDPEQLSRCAKMSEDAGYDEVNLNVGCPSDRVQSGSFGACLMVEPRLVAECVQAMKHTVNIPVTVKTRTGIDEHDSYEFLSGFVKQLVNAGVDKLIVHARKAWLSGLSPKQNREVPPLNYERVYQLKHDFPDLEIHINGGIKTVDEIEHHLQRVDGVMLGREAYHNPWILAQIDQHFRFCETVALNRWDIVSRLLPYIQLELNKGVKLHQITRHILGLFHGRPGARGWRRVLSESAPKHDADSRTINRALAEIITQ